MDNNARTHDARVTKDIFLGFSWAGAAISLCFLLFRLFVRVRSSRKLYSDDFLVTGAWGMLLASAILWQIEAPSLYEIYTVETGEEPLSPGFITRDAAFLRSIVPFNILFYSCLWTVKLSFLFFFRRLGSTRKSHKIWWSCVLVLTVLTWVVCVADIQYKCSLSSYEFIISYCTSRDANNYESGTFYANCAVDVITDCLILSIPVLMLWNVQIPIRKKLLLFAIFSATIIVMIISIIRVAVVISIDPKTDVSWLCLWGNIEMATSIIIACVASFHQLFVVHQRQHKGSSPGDSIKHRGLISYFRIMTKSSNNPSTDTKWPSIRTNNEAITERPDSQTHIIPMDHVHNKHTANV